MGKIAVMLALLLLSAGAQCISACTQPIPQKSCHGELPKPDCTHPSLVSEAAEQTQSILLDATIAPVIGIEWRPPAHAHSGYPPASRAAALPPPGTSRTILRI